jgi:hypothetical protein
MAVTLLLVLAGAAVAQDAAAPAPPAAGGPQVAPGPPAPAAMPSSVPPPPVADAGAAAPAESDVGGAYRARRSLLEDELRQLEAQRAEVGLGAPIALMVVGGGAFVIGGFIVMVAALSDAVCDDTYDAYDDCSGADDGVYVVGGLGMLGGGIAAIVGLVMLIDRAGERRTLGVRIKEIRRELASGPTYGLLLESGHAGASVRLRF